MGRGKRDSFFFFLKYCGQKVSYHIECGLNKRLELKYWGWGEASVITACMKNNGPFL